MNKASFKELILRIKNFLYQKLFIINDTPHKIAAGFGIGIFSGILPGTGPLAALFLAFVFKANRASALAGSILTNTWLSLVTFLLAIKTGSAIFNMSWQSLKNDWALALNHWHWNDLFSASILKLILPVICGYIIISVVLGLASYVAIFLILKMRRR